jgi:hypothetical protein
MIVYDIDNQSETTTNTSWNTGTKADWRPLACKKSVIARKLRVNGNHDEKEQGEHKKEEQESQETQDRNVDDW